jgi:hypothetical protein
MSDMRGPYTPGKKPKKSAMEEKYNFSKSFLDEFSKRDTPADRAGVKIYAPKVQALGTMLKLLKGKKK